MTPSLEAACEDGAHVPGIGPTPGSLICTECQLDSATITDWLRHRFGSK
ncbi:MULTISPECIES: hypothetical protein [unclassified Haladaptatus]|nr:MULTISPECIES: hypothetical protein [unclassified Haladaptatus]